jgi:acetyl-CoA C-acetyltransferase
LGTIADQDVVIVEAARSPLGRRNGGLATVHPVDLLATVQRTVIDRSGIDPALVGQVLGGCVSQVGEQTFNIARNAWLSAGLPMEVAGSTIDAQCGSSQQATNLAAAMVKAGVVDVAMACGVESMSRIPLGAATRGEFGRPTTASYREHYELTSQFEGAERIADKWGITRADADQFGLESQVRAQRAWAEGRFEREVVPIDAPDVGEDGKPTGTTHHVARDEGLRETSLEALAKLKPVARENGVHTAGNSSQISDGAAAVLLASRAKAEELGLTPRAKIVTAATYGNEPELMGVAPIGAIKKVLDRAGMTIEDVDAVELNEAFAAQVIPIMAECGIAEDKLNTHGGAIALGHPFGMTGARIMGTLLNVMETDDHQVGLETMCVAGGQGKAMVVERLN